MGALASAQRRGTTVLPGFSYTLWATAETGTQPWHSHATLAGPCLSWIRRLDFSILYLPCLRECSPTSLPHTSCTRVSTKQVHHIFVSERLNPCQRFFSWSSMEGVLLHLKLSRASLASSSLNPVSLPGNIHRNQLCPSSRCLQTDMGPQAGHCISQLPSPQV